MKVSNHILTSSMSHCSDQLISLQTIVHYAHMTSTSALHLFDIVHTVVVNLDIAKDQIQ